MKVIPTRIFTTMLLFLLIIASMLFIPARAVAPPKGKQVTYFPVISRPPNQAPVANILPSTASGTAPLVVHLDALASKDPDGKVRRYRWVFGDGTFGSEKVEHHIFSEPGLYPVTLVVFDNKGASAQTTMMIQVNEPAMMAKHVILFIGDGMGFEHVRAGGLFLNGAEGTLSFEAFPHTAEMTTHSVSGVTDSAAAATALATGVKVQNGVISMAVPGDERDLYTLLEYARDSALSTGLVTTTAITHATPAAFGAHNYSRDDQANIANDYLYQTVPNLLFGGAGKMTVNEALNAGYQVVPDRYGLLSMNTESIPPSASWISGQFAPEHIPFEGEGLPGQPHLSEMTAAALNILDNDPDGLFLVVEGGRIDHASHANNASFMVGEVAEFSRAVQAALEWAKTHPSTLIVVTADHETGGLQVLNGNGQGSVPSVTWSSSGHTGGNVPVYIEGAFEGDLPPVIDNTEIPGLISGGKFPGN